jgi:hypothetical protein
MATGFQLSRRGRVRDWLRGDAPASKGAQAFMFVAAMLCGAALAGLLFVGVWRHTAGEAASNKAAQVSDHLALRISRQTVATLTARLAHQESLLARASSAGARADATLARSRSALAQSRAALVQSRAALAHKQASDAAALHAVAARAAGLSVAASTLARATATLRSELAALESYAQNPGPTGIDPGYLATQMRYLDLSAASAAAAASDLARRAGAFQN